LTSSSRRFSHSDKHFVKAVRAAGRVVADVVSNALVSRPDLGHGVDGRPRPVGFGRSVTLVVRESGRVRVARTSPSDRGAGDGYGPNRHGGFAAEW